MIIVAITGLYRCSALFGAELAGAQAGTIKALNDKIRKPEVLAEDWTAYLSRSLAENVEAVQTPGTPKGIPGVPQEMSEEAILEQIKTYCGNYANALRAWPAIRSAAPGIVSGLTAL